MVLDSAVAMELERLDQALDVWKAQPTGFANGVAGGGERGES